MAGGVVNDAVTQPRLLLVEDDALVRITTAELLSAEGYQVIEAETAAEARTHLGAVEYLLADRTLPDCDGLELARAAHALHPGLAIVIASGRQVESGEFISLLKPFDLAALVAALDRALQAVRG